MRTFTLLALIGTFVTFSPPALADTLYGVASDGKLYQIDPSTAAPTFVGNTGFGSLDALDALPGGDLVAIAGGNSLIRIDPLTASASLIGVVRDASNKAFPWVEALAYGGGVLYGAASLNNDAQAERLVTINPATGIATDVGVFGAGATDIDGLGISSSGALFGTHILNPLGFYGIQTSNGSASLISAINGVVAALEFDFSDTLYGVDVQSAFFPSPSILVTIDTTTGAVTEIGNTGVNWITGIAFVSSSDPIPEPSTWALMALGCGGLIWWRRRRRAA